MMMAPRASGDRNGLARLLRLGAFLLDYALRPGGALVLFVLVLVGWEAGYIPSVSRDAVAEVRQHERQTSERERERVRVYEKLSTALDRLAEEQRRQNEIRKFRECAEIRDADLRRQCLRQ